MSIVRVEKPAEDVDKRSKILRLEAAMREQPNQLALPVRHYFAAGLYARELTIPADTTVTGKIHKHEHISIVSKGVITVVTEFGEETIEAPRTLVSPPGVKRAVYAHTEVVWTTIHATDETDLEKLEAELIAADYAELEGSCPGLQLR